MSIVRWEPFRDLLTTQDRFNRLFNGTFSRFFDEGAELGVRSWAPPVDIYETENELVLKADLPDVNLEDIEVRVENETLMLKGERKFEKDESVRGYHRIERSYGSFTRSFSVPATVDADKVGAEFKNGVLTVTLPKKEAAKPRQVKIEVKG